MSTDGSDTMSWRQIVAADLQRYDGAKGRRALIAEFLSTPGFRYTLLLRCCQVLQPRRRLYPLYVLLSLWLVRVGRLYGISIPVRATIGPGLYIGHYGGIVVHHDAVIGANCNLSQGVTIGQTNRGPRMGVPILGDDVYLGPGAKVIGGIRMGDRTAVGANAVVTRDVPADGVVVGVPARVVSMGGSDGYIQYPFRLSHDRFSDADDVAETTSGAGRSTFVDQPAPDASIHSS